MYTHSYIFIYTYIYIYTWLKRPEILTLTPKQVDPTVAVAAAITSLQSIVAREVAPTDQAVVSVTMIHGGDAYNVIPAQVCVYCSMHCNARNKLQHTLTLIYGGNAYNVFLPWSATHTATQCHA